MIRTAPILAIALALSGCGPSVPKCTAPNSATIASALYGRENLREMLILWMQLTETGKIVAVQDPVKFEGRLLTAVDRAVKRHGDQWEANLVQAYAETFSPQELVALCAVMNANDRAGLQKFTDRAGIRMKAISTPLFDLATRDVFDEMFEYLRKQ